MSPVWRSPSKPWTMCTPKEKALLEVMFKEGELSWKLTKSQQNSYHKVQKWLKRSTQGARYALDISRRWGKSVLLCALALEHGFKRPGSRIVYYAPTHEMVRKIVIPLMDLLLQDCPPGLRPEWAKAEGVYVFKNGSRIEVIGLDVRPDGARGTGVDMVFLDEAGFFLNLEYLVNAVISPQMLGRPHARIIAASTPPVSPSHYWSEAFVPQAIQADAHDLKTLDDADQYSKEEIDNFYALMPGGRNGITARREYRAQHIADDTMMVIPEFQDAEKDRTAKHPETGEEIVILGAVRELEPPTWRDCYVGMDPGWADMTGILYGYLDFPQQLLVIEDEDAVTRHNSFEIATLLKAKEKKLWGKLKRRGGQGFDGLKAQPYLRVSDNNEQRLLYDLSVDHGLAFMASKKDNMIQAVDSLRQCVNAGKLVIHPRCRKLIRTLRNAVWKRVPTMGVGGRMSNGLLGDGGSELGHFDLLPALIYMHRAVQWRRNPNPRLEQHIAGDIKVPHGAPGPQSKWARKDNRYFVKTGRIA